MGLFKKKSALVVRPLSASEIEQQAVLNGKAQPHHTVSISSSEDQESDTRKKNFCQQCLTPENLKEQALLIATVAAVIIGIGVGLALRGIKCTTGKHSTPERFCDSWHRSCRKKTFALVHYLAASLDERINGCRITPDDITYIDFPGKIFISVLKMLILPLIVSSIISSLAQLDAQSSGKMGIRALVYYFGTTMLAAILGIILVLTIRPGIRGGKVIIKADSKAAEGRTIDTVLDLFR